MSTNLKHYKRIAFYVGDGSNKSTDWNIVFLGSRSSRFLAIVAYEKCSETLNSTGLRFQQSTDRNEWLRFQQSADRNEWLRFQQSTDRNEWLRFQQSTDRNEWLRFQQ
ncbi:hypothetical protein CEXT_807001 [Caerostris extrusa]|uniref:Uncharacterized protein n=1 Tax=Caerostris extrusa TaxID=172846 RepID=A0AAV4VAF2_CAEEX|nr:hypothetical protein CEXT_807001 [Caerostris extrusa]